MTIIEPVKRNTMINRLSTAIQQITCSHPLRVAVDGVDAAGKTFLAEELVQNLNKSHRQIIRASVDDFHNPKSIRWEKGSLSPEGFYFDSYNYKSLIEKLLEPLGPDGNRRYQTSAFDLHRDRSMKSPLRTASEDEILIMDGIFLLRPELFPYWDLTIYLATDFKNSMFRGVVRDTKLIGSAEEATRRYHERYIPGQQLYHREVKPLDKADILIDNNDLKSPQFLRFLVG
ncbi:MAG: hypothetical protein U9R53_12190 [Chloroflexota bacterium]|nr:hypothetical protein [Chloroflexota bacterium]